MRPGCVKIKPPLALDDGSQITHALGETQTLKRHLKEAPQKFDPDPLTTARAVHMSVN